MRSPIPLIFSPMLRLGSVIVFLAASLTYGQAPSWGPALSFGGSGPDQGDVVKVDRKSNKYIAGDFSGTATFGPRTLTSAGGTDAFLMKFRSDGTFGWIVQIGGSDYDEAFDIGFDGNENVYLSGTFTNSATFGNNHGAAKIVTGAANSIFLAKYDPSGTLLWVQTGVSGFGNNEGFGVAVNPASGVLYMTGRSQGNLTFTSSNGSSHVVPGVGDWHVYLVKYDSAGNFQWGEVDAASVNSFATKVAIDSDNNAYAVGWFEGDATFSSSNGKSQTVHGLSQPIQTAPDFPDDTFVAKYDSHGDVQWVNDIGGYKAIAVDDAVSPSGELSVTGFIGNIDGDSVQQETIVSSQPPGSAINLGGGTFTSPYNPDAFVATYDSSGVTLRASRFGSTDADSASGIAYDAMGNLYISGLFGGTVDFDGTTLDGPDLNNHFVLKYTGTTLDWAKMASGAGEQTQIGNPRLCVNSRTGKVFVEGPYSGTAIFGGTTLKSAGGMDIFFASIPPAE